MTRHTNGQDGQSADSVAAVPFTARLNAYYRAVESKSGSPLFLDPYAERLAGDMTAYFEKHPRFTSMGGSQIARSYYIEHELLTPWCDSHETSQIVLLGAGLDTRAYRFVPLGQHSHTVFELDLPVIIKYKERILQNENPLCNLIRISTDLSQLGWRTDIQKRGFSSAIPTFWILEGVAYYLEKRQVHDLSKNLSEMSTEGSQLFVDVCVPALAELRWGPFTEYFKWGIPRDEISLFFASSGWSVSSAFLDTFSHGKDVGQKGLILVHGSRDLTDIDTSFPMTENQSYSTVLDIAEFSRELAAKTIPEIDDMVETYRNRTERLLDTYVTFMKTHETDLQIIARAQENPILLGLISPRLLGDPLSITEDSAKRTDEEILSFIISNLQAVVKLTYCGVKGIKASDLAVLRREIYF